MESRLCVSAVTDSSGTIVAERGDLSDQDLAAVIGHKAAGRELQTLALPSAPYVTDLDWDTLPALDSAPIAVDTSAARTATALAWARDRGWRAVLANKLPLTESLARFDEITRHGCGARWEATVAGALPVVSTLLALVERGDHIRWVTGALSGTLGYVLHRLGQGASLSQAVAECSARGYLEPDPRVDLSGLDVGRKALILARTIGYELDLDDVIVEGLYPAAWDELSPEEFELRLPEADELMARRFRVSREAGSTVRYLAYVGEGTARAQLADLSPGARLAQTSSRDSIVVIESDHFGANPLVLSGRAGGPKGTAAAVLGDVLSLVRD